MTVAAMIGADVVGSRRQDCRLRVARHRGHAGVAPSARDPARLGNGTARRSRRLGNGGRRGALAQRMGLGLRRSRRAPGRHRHPDDDGHCGRSRSARPSWLAGHGRASGTRRRAAAGACGQNPRVRAPALPRAGPASLGEEGFGPFQRKRQPVERSRLAEAVRLRRVLERAGGVYVKLGQIAATRVDLLPSDVCAELGATPEPCRRRSLARTIAAVLEAELGSTSTTCSPSSTGSRSPRPRSARPTRRRCVGRARRRQGPAARHRRHDGARPGGAGAARRPRPAAHVVRSRASGPATCSVSSP